MKFALIRISTTITKNKTDKSKIKKKFHKKQNKKHIHRQQ
jgi:hypothetical protein